MVADRVRGVMTLRHTEACLWHKPLVWAAARLIPCRRRRGGGRMATARAACWWRASQRSEARASQRSEATARPQAVAAGRRASRTPSPGITLLALSNRECRLTLSKALLTVGNANQPAIGGHLATFPATCILAWACSSAGPCALSEPVRVEWLARHCRRCARPFHHRGPPLLGTHCSHLRRVGVIGSGGLACCAMLCRSGRPPPGVTCSFWFPRRRDGRTRSLAAFPQ